MSTILNGTDLKLKLDVDTLTADSPTLVEVYLNTDASLSIEQEELEVTTKGSGGFMEVIAGKKSGSISFTGFVDMEQTTNPMNLEQLVSLFNADAAPGRGTLCAFELSRANSASNHGFSITGDAFLPSLEISGAVEETSQISGTLTLSGAYTITITDPG